MEGTSDWTDAEDMASQVANSLHRNVKVLRGSAAGRIHTSLSTYGRWEDADKAAPVCLLLWNDLLWKCDETGQVQLVVQH